MNGNEVVPLVSMLNSKPLMDGTYLVRVDRGYNVDGIDALSLCEWTETLGWNTGATYWSTIDGASIISWCPEPVVVSHFTPKEVRTSFVGELHESQGKEDKQLWIENKDGSKSQVESISLSFQKKRASRRKT